MAVWDNKEYDARATKIASAFSAGRDQAGASLTDLVEKVAREEGLVPEQVRRLARAANLEAWKVEFDRLKVANAPDRNVEFSLCDENEVLRRLQLAGEAAVKMACAVSGAVPAFPELPDAMFELRHPMPPAPPPTTKTAAELVAPLATRADMEILKLHRIEEEITIRAKIACDHWRGAMQQLLDGERRVTWTENHTREMEKAALALHGAEVLPEINALRRLRREAPLNIPTTKMASLQNHLDGTATKETALLKHAADSRASWRQLEAAKALAVQKRAYFESRLRRVP